MLNVTVTAPFDLGDVEFGVGGGPGGVEGEVEGARTPRQGAGRRSRAVDGGGLADDGVGEPRRERTGHGVGEVAASLLDSEAGYGLHGEVVAGRQRAAASQQNAHARSPLVEVLDHVEHRADRWRGRRVRVGLSEFLARVEDEQHIAQLTQGGGEVVGRAGHFRALERRDIVLVMGAGDFMRSRRVGQERLKGTIGQFVGGGVQADIVGQFYQQLDRAADRVVRCDVVEVDLSERERLETAVCGIPAGEQVTDEHGLADPADAAKVQSPAFAARLAQAGDRVGEFLALKVVIQVPLELLAACAEGQDSLGAVKGAAGRSADERRQGLAGGDEFLHLVGVVVGNRLRRAFDQDGGDARGLGGGDEFGPGAQGAGHRGLRRRTSAAALPDAEDGLGDL